MPGTDATSASVADDSRAMSRSFLFASALKPDAAARSVATAPRPVDLVVASPSPGALEAAAYALRGRWVPTLEEPLLAMRVPGEGDDDVFGRLAQALRTVCAYSGRAPLIMFDALDILGASAFLLDEDGIMRLAESLERALPVP